MRKKKSITKNNKNKAGNTSKMNEDYIGIILMAIGVFLIVSYLAQDFTGILGEYTRKITVAVFGVGVIFLPVLLMFFGLIYIKAKGKIVFTKRFLGVAMFMLTTLLLFGNIVFPSYTISRFWDNISIFNGGVVSHLILTPIRGFIGTIGSYILIIVSYFISYLNIFDTTIKEIYTYFKSINKDRDIAKEAKDDIKDYVKKTDESKNKINFKDIDNKNAEPIKIKNFEENQGKIANEKKATESKDDIGEIASMLDSSVVRGTAEEYSLPRVELLTENVQTIMNKHDKKELLDSATKLEDTLLSFGVKAKVLEVSKGPSVTRYELQPSAGVKVSKIINLSDDIALNLAAKGVRIEAPIPGKAAVGIEIPNKNVSSVFLKEVIDTPGFRESKSKLAFALGKDVSGTTVVADLTKMPHLLIAGATGSGKSVCINTLIVSLLYKYSPNDVKLLMIDPKVVELNVYNGIPHLLIPVVTNPKKAAGALHWAVNEMTKRYQMFAENGVRNIEGYNELVAKGKLEGKLQWIVIIIDELADLMMVCPNDVEDYIARLAQMARAAGMHLVIATQRPSVDVITGVIKANIPSRISFAVSSQIDSRTILDSGGAEKLLGKGDMLYYPVGESKPVRVQGAFISEEEVEKIVDYIKKQGEESYKEEIIEAINNTPINSKSKSNDEGEDEDELLNEAIKIVYEEGQASASMLQRRMRVGYNRAARIIDSLEAKGIISGKDGSKPRTIMRNQDRALE